MDDGEAVNQAARDAIVQHGNNAAAVLPERAEFADDMGDMLAAEAWREMADAAEQMLRSGAA